LALMQANQKQLEKQLQQRDEEIGQMSHRLRV
jgi:hypothetical protein